MVCRFDFIYVIQCILHKKDSLTFNFISHITLSYSKWADNYFKNVSFYEINSDNIQHIDSISYEKAFNSFK